MQDIPVSGVIAIVAPAEVDDAAVEETVQRATAELDVLTAAIASGEDESGPVVTTIPIGGHTISYATVGGTDEEGAPVTEGDVVVLVHGFGGDRDSWLFVQEPLASAGSGRVVHALDLPGHGASSKTLASGTTLTDLAELLVTFLDDIGASLVHLVGHSMGGAIAAAAAARAPNRVASLTLVAPAGVGADVDAEYLRGFAAGSSRRELKPLLGRLFADAAQVTRQLVDDVVKYKRLDGVAASLQAALGVLLTDEGTQAIDTPSALASLAESPVPVTVIWGAQDAVLPVPTDGSALGASSIELVIAPEAGHMAHMEAPHTVLEVVERRLRA
jgi:pyruvate dehydrogenase E2 component (dihydrolipoamide acetyltransferase)